MTAGSLGALVNTEAWVESALCSQTDPEQFFPEKGGARATEAKKICWSCPVREACLDYAIRRGEPHGIWGGYSDRERRRMRRGLSPAPVRTHCQRGHELAVVGLTKQNSCKQCRKLWEQNYQKRLDARYERERQRRSA